MPIRNAVKAIIIENDCLLCIEFKDERGLFYGLPGGGQDYQETLHAAVHRECLEEIGARVKVGPLLFVREYIGKNYPELPRFVEAHQIEFLFHCELLEGEQPTVGAGADRAQIGVRWVPLAELVERAFTPLALVPFLADLRPKPTAVYLGDIN